MSTGIYKLIPRSEFTFLRYSDNGHTKKLDFMYDGRPFQWTYNYGKNYGFIFISEYPNENALAHPLSMNGGNQIYGSINSECTPLGRLLEHSLQHINFEKNEK